MVWKRIENPANPHIENTKNWPGCFNITYENTDETGELIKAELITYFNKGKLVSEIVLHLSPTCVPDDFLNQYEFNDNPLISYDKEKKLVIMDNSTFSETNFSNLVFLKKRVKSLKNDNLLPEEMLNDVKEIINKENTAHQEELKQEKERDARQAVIRKSNMQKPPELVALDEKIAAIMGIKNNNAQIRDKTQQFITEAESMQSPQQQAYAYAQIVNLLRNKNISTAFSTTDSTWDLNRVIHSNQTIFSHEFMQNCINKSAEMGDYDGMFRRATSLLDSNKPEAFRLLKIVAEMGDPDAARVYANYTDDLREKLKYFELADRLGDINALTFLPKIREQNIILDLENLWKNKPALANQDFLDHFDSLLNRADELLRESLVNGYKPGFDEKNYLKLEDFINKYHFEKGNFLNTQLDESNPKEPIVHCDQAFEEYGQVSENSPQEYVQAQFNMALIIRQHSNLSPESFDTEAPNEKRTRIEAMMPYLERAAKLGYEDAIREQTKCLAILSKLLADELPTKSRTTKSRIRRVHFLEPKDVTHPVNSDQKTLNKLVQACDNYQKTLEREERNFQAILLKNNCDRTLKNTSLESDKKRLEAFGSALFVTNGGKCEPSLVLKLMVEPNEKGQLSAGTKAFLFTLGTLLTGVIPGVIVAITLASKSYRATGSINFFKPEIEHIASTAKNYVPDTSKPKGPTN